MKNVPSCKTICWTKWAIKSFANIPILITFCCYTFLWEKLWLYNHIFCFFRANLHCLLSAKQNNVGNKENNYALINLSWFSIATRHPYSQWDELLSEEAVLFLSIFSNFSCIFLNPNKFFNSNSNCSKLLDMRNLQEQVEKLFC